ncbi:large subunit ribosomal protein L29 [Ereboglobus sp. PH5-10]|uniref:Large ribosomal subunit protein uL29 n=1 Tax=Ereboglobus luteus TaxID=1796921 RepID=A0A2U8E2S7_9BACT|nr:MULTISPECIES: 50S ribosomal protein L29 [Ereboglobus]AWI09131.1 50S ribosomal protein L29 [Ereboglobus luteus]MDF9826311.1 large subunit ribosomal protein L29 [Ereboglobus sp. PH5-10]
MTSKEINELSLKELDVKLREAREQLLQLRLRKQTGQVEKTHTIRGIRKDIARMETTKTAKLAAAAK